MDSMMPKRPRPRGPRKPCRCTIQKSYLILRRGRGTNLYARIQSACSHRTVLVDFSNARTVDPRRVREEMIRWKTVIPSRLRARSAAETPSDDDLDASDPIGSPTTGGGRRKGKKPDLSETESGMRIQGGCKPLWNAPTEASVRAQARSEDRVDAACRRLLNRIYGDDE